MRRDLGLLILSILFTNFLAFGVSLYSGIYLQQLGAHDELIILILLGAALLSCLLFPFAGYLASSLGPRKMLLLAPLVGFIAFLIFMFSSTWYMVFVATILIALSSAINISGLLVYLESTVSDVSEYGYGIALFAFAVCQFGGVVSASVFDGSVSAHRMISLMAALSSLIGVFLRIPLLKAKSESRFSNLKEAYRKAGVVFKGNRLSVALLCFSFYTLLSSNVFAYVLVLAQQSVGIDILDALWVVSSISAIFIVLLGFLASSNVVSSSTKRVDRWAKKRVPSPLSAGVLMVLFVLVGAALGYFAGYVVWVLFGQIQVLFGVWPPYAALFPPPLLYLIAWSVLGAWGFPFQILPELLK